MQKNGLFDQSTAVDIIISLCRTLHTLHSCSPPIIHRDIKPSNIILTSEMQPILIDFNAAKTLSTDKNRDTVLMGTADFAATEQYGFSQSDARTDIYALGVLLNTMLTGSVPNVSPYRGKLAAVISKCVSIDPQQRYSSIVRLRRALLSYNHILLPPGFRSGKMWKMITAVIGYALICLLSFGLQLEEPYSRTMLLSYRTASFIIFMLLVALFTNYLNIADKLPLSRSKNILVKISGILIWSAVCIILVLIALTVFLTAADQI